MKRVIAILMLLVLVASPILAVIPFGTPANMPNSVVGEQEICTILTNDPDVDNEFFVSTAGIDTVQ